MPFLILLAVAALWFVWYNWGRNRARDELGRTLDPLANKVFRRKPCRWSKTQETKDQLRAYRCETCHVTAYSSSGRAPQDCKRAAKSTL